MTDSEHADIHEDIRHIKEVIAGNGKKGMVRDIDDIQQLILRLRQDFDKMEGRIEKVLSWLMGAIVSTVGLIALEVVLLLVRRGKL